MSRQNQSNKCNHALAVREIKETKRPFSGMERVTNPKSHKPSSLFDRLLFRGAIPVPMLMLALKNVQFLKFDWLSDDERVLI